MTLALPPHLAPWRQTLELFPQDLAMTLGAWIPRLAATVGPLGADPADDGEPDGFSGLARRGPYERLLHSEWMLLDHAPDEFVRRAVDGEHAFVELSRRQPRAARRTVAVFDAGPDQIGAPRLAHLAALLVFEQRARTATADLHWGLAHAPDHVHECVTKESVLALVQGRTARLPDEANLRPWLDRAAGDDADDLWLVGHRLAELARRMTPGGFSSLSAHDILALDRTAIEVRIARRRRQALSFELPVPEPRAAARLLRDPFEARTAAPSPDAAASDAVPETLMFSMGGERLVARRRDGSVVAWHVPNQPGTPPGKTKILQAPLAPEAIVAIQDVRRRRAVFATVDGGDLVWRRGDQRKRFRAPRALLDAAHLLLSGDCGAPLWRLARISSSSCYLLLAHTGTAFVFDARISRGRGAGSEGDSCEIDTVIEDVAAVSWQRGSPARLWWGHGDSVSGFLVDPDGSLRNGRRIPMSGSQVVAGTEAVAAGDERGDWRIYDTEEQKSVKTRVPEGARVLGISNRGELVAISDSGRGGDVLALRGDQQRRVYRADEAIAAATLSTSGDRLGLMSTRGTARAIDVASGTSLAWVTRGTRA